MKKTILGFVVIIFLVFLTSGSCRKQPAPAPEEAHFEVMDLGGQPLENNHVFTFSVSDSDRTVVLVIKNTTHQTLHLKTKLVEVSGTDGSQMEFCFKDCYMGMTPGTAYPLEGTLDIAALGVTPVNAIHYTDHSDGPAEYTIDIYEVDNSGNKTGQTFRFKFQVR